MADLPNDMLLLAYVEGEANERERARVEALIEQDPRLGYLLARLIADRQSLQQLADPPAPDWLMEEIDRQLERDMLVVGTFVDAEQTVLRQRRLVSRLVMGGALAAMVAVVATVLVSSLTSLQPPVTTVTEVTESHPPPSPPAAPEAGDIQTPGTAPIATPGTVEPAGSPTPVPEALAEAGKVGPAPAAPIVPPGGEPASVTPGDRDPADGVADAAIEPDGEGESTSPTGPPAEVAAVAGTGKTDDGDDPPAQAHLDRPGLPDVFATAHPGVAPGLLPVPKPQASVSGGGKTMRPVEGALEISRLLVGGGPVQAWILVSRDRQQSVQQVQRLAESAELKWSATGPQGDGKSVHRLSGPSDQLARLLMRVSSDPATTKLFQVQPLPRESSGNKSPRAGKGRDEAPVRTWPQWKLDFAAILQEQVKTGDPATARVKSIELELQVLAATTDR